ncbi:hypothetical protein DER46DRAFT_664187 [Fusarium sp. MPI-SDFR-AT-0072]|nr:hypothetical protein DER46DRAFT_664187 [Fusarium sp. MPI-SDFR-AT-0072]
MIDSIRMIIIREPGPDLVPEQCNSRRKAILVIGELRRQRSSLVVVSVVPLLLILTLGDSDTV